MLRRLCPLLPAVSLLLCVATCVLWVRSYAGWGLMSWQHDGPPPWDEAGPLYIDREVRVAAWRGQFLWERATFRLCVLSEPEEPGWHFSALAGDGRLPGFAAVAERTAQTSLPLPMWVPMACTAVLPAAWVVMAVRRNRRRERGLCPGCGYDLRATPGRCPECGRVPADPAPR